MVEISLGNINKFLNETIRKMYHYNKRLKNEQNPL